VRASRVFVLVLAIASSHSLLFSQGWVCYEYQGLNCGLVVFQSYCGSGPAEYYYQWDGTKYSLVGCSPSPSCGSCSHPPCVCVSGGQLLFNYYCAPCGPDVPDGGGSGGDGGSGGGDSGGGGCDLCSTLSQSNNYLNQILERITNLDVKIDLTEVIRRLDRIISNQGMMLQVQERMANDLEAIRVRLAGIDTQLMMLTDIVDQRLRSIDQKLNKLDDIKSALEGMRQLIELQGQKLDAIKDLVGAIWDYLRDDQAFEVIRDLTAAQLLYLDARLQYFYDTLFLSVASYGGLADLLYSTFASQYQRVNFSNDLIRVVGGGFVPYYSVVSEPNELVLYGAGLLQGAVSGWLTAVNTHYLPLASFPNFVIYLNLDHPEVFWVRQILRLMIAVWFVFFFVKRRYEEVTALFAEVGDNA
jgi:hypothetical protein